VPGNTSFQRGCESLRLCAGLWAARNDFVEAGKKRLAGDTARAATSDEVKDLRRETSALKEVVAELTLENRLLKKSMTADGTRRSFTSTVPVITISSKHGIPLLGASLRNVSP
jgi:hypothetical protein